MSRPDTVARGPISLAPTRDQLRDAGLLLVLMTLALYGFRSTFSGWGYLLVGVIGTLLGILIAHLTVALRLPFIVDAGAAVVVFFAVGGALTVRGTVIGGVLPGAGTVRQLADTSVHGWRDLLTTLPPVNGAGSFLVLPFILGLAGATLGMSAAGRVRISAAPVVVPVLVLAAVIVLGTQTPSAGLMQGAVFGVVALGWLALRSARLRPPIRNSGGRWARTGTVAALLTVAFGGAALLGPHIPGAEANRRTVLRNYVQPPFNIGQYPSPLAGFRRYTKPQSGKPGGVYNQALFTVDGLPAGTFVRIATMDSYDGLTWAAANLPATPGQPADTFQRVGTTIDDPASGRQVSYTVRVGPSYNQVWLPSAGALTRLSFTGDRAAGHSEFFRYDLATSTGVVPDGLQSGDSYVATAALDDQQQLTASDPIATTGTAFATSSFLRGPASEWAGTGSAFAQLQGIERHLHSGAYTNGEAPNQQYLAGHSTARLLTFINGQQMAGNQEQYAATMALAANQLGIPARVVLGAQVNSTRATVYGRDVTAWVQVQLTDGSWRFITDDQFMDRNHPPKQLQQDNQTQQATELVPPPARGRPHNDELPAGDSTASISNRHKAQAAGDDGFTLPAWVTAAGRWGGPPVLAVLTVVALIIGLKVERRRRRRLRGTPSDRFAHGWREVLDYARDLGTVVPSGGTRREQATLLNRFGLMPLAVTADAQVFGHAAPDDQIAAGFWQQVDAARVHMRSGLSRWQRLRAAANPASLRRPKGGDRAR